MRIIGIDPGYAIVGFGVIDTSPRGSVPLEFGVSLTEAGTDFGQRLLSIYTDIDFLFEKYKPDCIAIEKLFFTTNQKTAIDVAQARGIILLLAAQKKIKLFEYTPLQVKQAVTGYGKAKKHQVMEMTRRLLTLTEIPKPDDAADALAIALRHAQNASRAAMLAKNPNKLSI